MKMSLLKQTALGCFRPNLTIYLDIEPKLGLERARGKGELDRIEKMDLGFFERTRRSVIWNLLKRMILYLLSMRVRVLRK